MLRGVILFSLGIAILATLAWSASYIRPRRPTLIRASSDRAIFVTSRWGVLALWTQEVSPPPPAGALARLTMPGQMSVAAVAPRGAGSSMFSMQFSPDWPRPDMAWELVQNGRGTVYVGGTPYTFALNVRRFVIAWWAIVAIALIAPALRLAWWLIRRRRIVAGRCAVCGYDLRATPDRCPECGFFPEKKSDHLIVR